MPKRNEFPYPHNVIMSAFGSIKTMHGEPNADSIIEAIRYVVGKDNSGKLRRFVELRYHQNLSYSQIAEKMGYKGVERPRQLDSKFISHMHDPKAISIIRHGVDNQDAYIENAGGRWELPLNEMELDIRSYNCIVRYFRYHHDPSLEIRDIKAKHIVELLRSDDILRVRNLGRKTITDKLIPRLMELGFTRDELT